MQDEAQRWLARGVEVLAEELSRTEEDAFHCDVLIVGSGYGAAVAAARMAGATVGDDGGRKARVLMMERGLERLPGRFPSKFSELAGEVRFSLQDGKPPRGNAEGLFDVRLGTGMSVLLGNGLGGGSLINAGVMERPQAEVFAKGWPAAFGGALPKTAYAKAESMLAAMPVSKAQECDKLLALDRLARRRKVARCAITVNLAGAEATTADGARVPSCTLCGDCMTGCNIGAKRSLDTGYLASARREHVEIYCGGVVEYLKRNASGKGWAVAWHYTDANRRPRPATPFFVNARHVVLAAGALGSTEILLRTREAEPKLAFSSRLGLQFCGNGDAIVAGIRHDTPVHAVGDQESDPAGQRRIGPTITGVLRVPADDQGPAFVIQEFGVPAALRQVFGEVVATLASATDAMWDGASELRGADPLAISDAAIDRSSLFGMICAEEAKGTLKLGDDRKLGVEAGVCIEWPTERGQAPEFQSATDRFVELLAPAVAVFPAGSVFSRASISVHPLGGCAMADSIEGGVVDDCGRVFSGEGAAGCYADLAVLDGSIVPCALGINPALTITALAERALPELMKHWQLDAAVPGGEQAPPLPRRPITRRLEQPAPDAAWSIRERQEGPFRWTATGETYWARLDIEFEELPGFRRALALDTRRLGVRRATLALWPAKDDVDSFSASTEVPACCAIAELSGHARLFVAKRPEVKEEGEEDDGDDPRVELIYELGVQTVSAETATPLAVGAQLVGTKTFGPTPGKAAEYELSPWLQLSQMDVCYEGQPVGRWTLDLADLAERNDPLLHLTRLSTMPDALGDLASIGLYLLRRVFVMVLSLSNRSLAAPGPQRLAERKPGTVSGRKPEQHALEFGAFLSRYSPVPAGKQLDLPPIVLIHGLAMSGSTFTHESLPTSLVASLLQQGRSVWVLDTKSSIANESGRKLVESDEWTVEDIANRDIPAAISLVCKIEKTKQVDVFAHCIGGMMFCMATLGSKEMVGKVRSAALSQVGPLVTLSPLNRLRGYLAAYVWRYGQIKEFDSCPKAGADGAIDLLLDALWATFPYMKAGEEASRVAELGHDFRPVRHRSDMIFGQMFELENMADETLKSLEALFGWVKVAMLAQGIQFARQGMLTNANGRNVVLQRENFDTNFGFPILMIHGRRNRVFDWQGGLRSLTLLRKLRSLPDSPAESIAGLGTHWGKGTSVQLMVFDKYGHLDPILGKDAAADVFPVVKAFYDEARGLKTTTRPSLDPEPEPPWIGPMLGPLAVGGRWLKLRLLVHIAPRRAATDALAIVPLIATEAGIEPHYERARKIPWPDEKDVPCQQRTPSAQSRKIPRPSQTGMLLTPLKLQINASQLKEGRLGSFALFSLHRDLPLEMPQGESTDFEFDQSLEGIESRRGPADTGPALETLKTKAPRKAPEWLLGGRPLEDKEQEAARLWLGNRREAWREGVFTVTPRVAAAADMGRAKTGLQQLSFALASCQYPAGPLDERPASLAYERLLRDTELPAGPQFLVLAGDQVYVDATAGVFDPDATSFISPTRRSYDLNRIYERSWRLPAVRRTIARLPVFAMLDDHEVRNNFAGIAAGIVDEAATEGIRAFYRYEGMLAPDRPLGPDGSSSYFLFPGGMPFFVLDTRSRRDQRTAETVASAGILHPEVMKDLLDRLEKCPAGLPKFIVSPSPLLPPERLVTDSLPERLRSDSWSGFPASASTLLRAIRDRDIRRVVLLAGDSHLSTISAFTFDGEKNNPNQVISIVSSGLYTPWPFANQRADDIVLDGPVELGLPGGESCAGTMALGAMSTLPGYALVSVALDDNGGSTLRASLRSANGATATCVYALR